MRKLRCLVDELSLPSGWRRDTLVAAVAERRKRSITLVPVRAELVQYGHSGLWLAREHDDVVLYADHTSARHATHIVCHELAHMLLRHDEDPATRADAGDTRGPGSTDVLAEVRAAVPTAGTVRAVFGRSSYSDRQEYDAELLATLVMSTMRSHGSADRTASRIVGSL
ncbi:hypothetical protein HCA44_10960 [Rhodococcus sp. HNM0569]|nr:hypothetical protein [Rhodococcus sp. HNM0569]